MTPDTVADCDFDCDTCRDTGYICESCQEAVGDCTCADGPNEYNCPDC